jgi:hypothetical protein
MAGKRERVYFSSGHALGDFKDQTQQPQQKTG